VTAETNVQLIKAWVDAINRNDVQAELACWQPDGEFEVVATATVYKGLAELERAGRVSASLIAGQPAQGRKQITNLFASEDWTCVEYSTHATIAGPIRLRGVEVVPDGVTRSVETRVCVIAHVSNGKMDRAREYFDSGGIARQLGLDSATVAAMYSSLGTAVGPQPS
jgi:ketosteroid isomerase-like protein